jgi:hypothetical protein
MNKPSFKGDAPETKENLVGSDLRRGAFRLLPALTNVYLTKLRPEEDKAAENLQIVRLHDQENVYEIDTANRHKRAVLELSKKGFLRGKAPEVTIRPWHRVPGVAMSEVSQDEESD